jgi:hypothetical protein
MYCSSPGCIRHGQTCADGLQERVERIRSELVEAAREAQEVEGAGDERLFMRTALDDAIGRLEAELMTLRSLLVSSGVAIDPPLYMELRDKVRDVETAVNEVRWVASESSS